MKFTKLAVICSSIIAASTHASDLTIGNPASTLGSLELSGYLRAKFQSKDYSEDDHHINFNSAKINLDYKSLLLTGHMEYRCYQFNKLCDFSSLVDGWLNYEVNSKQNLTVGIQTLPFGPSRYWESNYIGGINTQVGIEDIHNLGINYQFKPLNHTTIDLAYFPSDAGTYHGSNAEASRYTANYIRTDNTQLTSLEEKKMWVGRINQDLNILKNDHLKTSVGASYWYSDIENKRNGNNGHREAWSAFSQIAYDNLQFLLIGGQNKVSTGDIVNPDISTMGAFDDIYTVANQGTFYTADLSYTFKNVYPNLNITPYLMFSLYQKDKQDFKDSSRNVVGTAFEYKNLSLVAEYIMGKNDPLIGGSYDALSYGDTGSTNNLFNLIFNYYF
ncbi:hypothetical protein I5515_01790 [Acinetobacter calcoaceticus]|uniref:hypothetical protein n=1 Tax=Acinetobacter calcoaceticus TaxID=471 RepID=UPI001901CEDF|nr:hypothetical protein [Acinetobacter calcoaceticus]MBJ9720534.1 hypothetical protein [Acinetobacter calcoaceticus]